MPRRRALRTLGAALAVGAFPALRPGRAVGHAGRSQDCPSPNKRCFVEIPYGTHEGGCCSPAQECCKGPNFDPVHPNLFSWCCTKGECADRTGVQDPLCKKASCGGVTCPPGNKCCARTQLMPKSRCYDPENECCTPVKGVVLKRTLPKLEWCPDRRPKKNHTPRENGCGPEDGVFQPFIPNTYLSANFKPACNFHDICYETCRKSKAVCDERFLKLMQDECENVYGFGIRRQTCKAQAYNYYLAVKKGGGDAYEAAQRAACNCC